jgi:site-specific DNA-methyltransferase (adenine-specific)
LVPYINNPRVNDRAIDAVAGSIAEFGFKNPIIVDRNNVIIAGHTRLLAARKLGLDQVPVIRAEDLTEKQVKAFRIADNRTAEFSEWDDELLAMELEGLEDMFTGFSEDEIDALLGQDGPAGVVEDDYEIVPPEEPITKPGDLWLLGRHRLLCGDATKKEDVERLMDGKKVDSMITDPPYGVDYSGKNEFLNKFDKGNRIQKPITNDATTDYRKFFSDFMGLAPLAEYNTVYIFMSNKELHSLRLALDDCGYSWGDYLVWVKNNHVLGRKDYNAKHEFIVYGWKGKHKFYGGFSTTVLEFDRPLRSDLHPTMKPIPLLVKLINDGLPAKGKVYDPFGGSGSTLIAAEQLNRTCYMMELDPVYCDVIVQRWENLTGQKAEMISG